jgi:hypothetical protein
MKKTLKTGLTLVLLTVILFGTGCQRPRTQPTYTELPRTSPQESPNIRRAEAPKIQKAESDRHFNRIALFPLHENKPDGPTCAEIVVATSDGLTALYADSAGEGLGFVDLSDPANPKAGGYVALSEEPTSLAVTKQWALIVTDNGDSQGSLVVLDLATRQIVAQHALPGQPDAIAVSPDKSLAAIAIENEETDFPAAPPGSVAVVSLVDKPENWTIQEIALEGLDCAYPEDPEPEYLSINSENVAVVSLQENNHVVLIDLKSSKVISDFTAGTVDMDYVDLIQNKWIEMVDSRVSVPREPDSIDWCSQGIVTADEGDLHGGSRSWTLFAQDGTVKWNSAAETEHIARNLGQYPDRRSEDRGTEPEAIKSEAFGDQEFVFIGCERSNLVLVYLLYKDSTPRFLQALPGGPGPESVACLPEQNLLLVGAEVDEPEDDLRAYLNIYKLSDEKPHFPSIESEGIPWCALSGLAASPAHPNQLFTVTDKALKPNSILTVDTSPHPARIMKELLLMKKGEEPEYDLEGISVAAGGGFWLVCEGDFNGLLRVDPEGHIVEEIVLPADVEEQLVKHGMEGVAEVGDHVYVAFQSLWRDDPEPTGHIGRYHPSSGQWAFATYPRAEAHYAAGLSSGPKGELCVLVRDKLAREQARTKEVLRLSLDGFESGQLTSPGRLDLTEVYLKNNLPVPEKIEGLAFDGQSFWVVNDNDAMKDSYGETQLISAKANKQ